MRFYGRERELSALSNILVQSHQQAQMTIISGRRRVGKTTLVRQSLREKAFLYFFVARKEESLLVSEYVAQIERTLAEIPAGTITNFQQLFAWLCQLAQHRQLNVVIDEFQEFHRINPSIYADIQNLWDQNKDTMRMNLLLSGSIQSLMRKIFDDYSEPLFGRATGRIHVQPFRTSTLLTIAAEHHPNITPEDFLGLYTITGGIPKYVEYFVNRRALTHEGMVAAFFAGDTILLEEGKALLLEEFGKEYRTYFSILSLIAAGKTSRSAITSIMERNIGGQLEKLEKDYQLIRAVRPLFSKPQSRNIKFSIDDNFLNFWFRFIFKNSAAIELQNYDFVQQVIARDYATYSGLFLERLIRQQLGESGLFSHVGNYWRRDGTGEIDVIAWNELNKRAIVGEVKRNPKAVSLPLLEQKAIDIQRELGGFEVTLLPFSLGDVLGGAVGKVRAVLPKD